MQISEAAAGTPAPGVEPCRFPKLEECAHFHYERVQLPKITIELQTNIDQSLHSQHNSDDDDTEWYMVQVTSGDECWLLQRNLENFKLLDAQLHQCIYDRKIFQLPDLSSQSSDDEDVELILKLYLDQFSNIADNTINCGPVLNWLQMDNKGHRLLVPSEESRSINTPAVAAAYGIRRYVSQARDELNLEVGDMISVIDMANPSESIWWRGKRGFQVGFFPQHCVHIIGDKIPRNMPLPPPVVGSLALTPIKPVLRKHGKLITFFRSFILNRPSRRRLKQSGILKERVFGCDLGEHLLNSGHDIPMVLKCCSEFIESHGIVDGIYRLSGVTSNIQKLRNAFDEDRIPNLYTEDILQDIHSVASLLKMYFRELPNPLCTYQLYQSFVHAVQGCASALTRNSENDHDRLLKMREAVQKLPPPHYRTLEYLMKHLAKVAKHGESTGMTTRNIAIVWAPNLLRCAELEVGGVAALQGVGVQAVVTEFLICYSHLIFCDNLPKFDIQIEIDDTTTSPKKIRPKSLAISAPAKLITLEEARTKYLLNNKNDNECNYIEVGGGPKNLPKKYHTIIELPNGARKRSHTKRSPLGWRSLFTKSRNNSQNNLTKTRKASTPGVSFVEKCVTESDLTDMKRKLRTVKSAESLTSGHSEPATNEVDVLGPLYSLNKPPGHNRSVSHDSYFDTLQTNSQNNSEASLLDLSEIQLNFELEESEMRIFSEDESLVSSPRMQKDLSYRRILTRARPDDLNTSATNSVNPSPKKQARVILLSPDSMSRKRTKLEDQLSDIQYIDCNTPDNIVTTTTIATAATITTTTTMAIIHNLPKSLKSPTLSLSSSSSSDDDEPKNKSPRNSNDYLNKRQSLNLDNNINKKKNISLTKSFTEIDINRKYLNVNNNNNSLVRMTTLTPQSPSYKQLGESSTNTTTTTPDYSSSNEVTYQYLNKNNSSDDVSPVIKKAITPTSISLPNTSSITSPITTTTTTAPTYENILTTISITYKSPKRSNSNSNDNTSSSSGDLKIYENMKLVNPEKAIIPTSIASLPNQQATQPIIVDNNDQLLSNSSSCSSTNNFYDNQQFDEQQLQEQETISLTNSTLTTTNNMCNYLENDNQLLFTPTTDLSLSEIINNSSTDNLNTITSQTSFSSPKTPTNPNISPILESTIISNDSIDDDDDADNNNSGDDNFVIDDNSEQIVYEQVKFLRRSVHEVNALLTDDDNCDDNIEIYENVEQSPQHYDSLEPESNLHLYENIVDDNSERREELKSDGEIYENMLAINDDDDDNLQKTDDNNTKNKKVDNEIVEEKLCVKDLTSRFEEKDIMIISTESKIVDDNNMIIINNNKSDDNINKLRKFYEKDSLPPCLRARNLKYQFKTRSLDEEEFNKELNYYQYNNDDNNKKFNIDNYKSNSLPKKLNQPKFIKLNDDDKIKIIDKIHLSHNNSNSNDNLLLTSLKEEIKLDIDEEQRKRERIEKYKEERRKFLQEKYRSESFKEDKDILLSKLKLYKVDQIQHNKIKQIDSISCCSNSSDGNNDDNNSLVDSIDNDSIKSFKKSTCSNNDQIIKKSFNNELSSTIVNKQPIIINENLRSRAAIFEQQSNNQRFLINNDFNNRILYPQQQQRNIQTDKDKKKIDVNNDIDDDKDNVEYRNKKIDVECNKIDKRRHTFETREREIDNDRLRRVSLECQNVRKEKSSPAYCIKDMKAIFESKSKQ